MNNVVLSGRLTRDPEIRYTTGENATAVATYTLAVDRRFKRQGDAQTADFIRCITFGPQAEFTNKYMKQGTKMVVRGRIQTGSYVNKDGQKVYTTDVVIEEQEFAESKAAGANREANANPQSNNSNSFMNIPDEVDDDESYPWNN